MKKVGSRYYHDDRGSYTDYDSKGNPTYHRYYHDDRGSYTDYIEPMVLTEKGRRALGEDTHSSSSYSPGSSDGCFIATVAYGSPMATQLHLLRRWRDETLYGTTYGQCLCSIYYKVSPPLALLIENSHASKAIVRALFEVNPC